MFEYEKRDMVIEVEKKVKYEHQAQKVSMNILYLSIQSIKQLFCGDSRQIQDNLRGKRRSIMSYPQLSFGHDDPTQEV